MATRDVAMAAARKAVTAQHLRVNLSPALPVNCLFRRSRRGRPPRALREGRVTTHLNGRTAMWHAIKSLGLSPSANVLVPSYACGVEVDAILHADVNVKFYDVRRSTAINLQHLLQVLDDQTGAVVVTHYFGFPQPTMSALVEICRGRGIALIEDCAHTLYSGCGGRALGSFGDLAIYSLRKLLPVPNGGFLRCNNPALSVHSGPVVPSTSRELHSLLRSLPPQLVRHGLAGRALNRLLLPPLTAFALRLARRDSLKLYRQFVMRAPVFNPLTTEFGISCLGQYLWKRCDHGRVIRRRRRNFRYLLERLRGMESFKPLFEELGRGVCPMNFPGLAASPRDLCIYLKSRRVFAEPWWNLTHHMVPIESFPETCWLKKHVIALPIHQDLEIPDLDLIVAAVRDWADQQSSPSSVQLTVESVAT